MPPEHSSTTMAQNGLLAGASTRVELHLPYARSGTSSSTHVWDTEPCRPHLAVRWGAFHRHVSTRLFLGGSNGGDAEGEGKTQGKGKTQGEGKKQGKGRRKRYRKNAKRYRKDARGISKDVAGKGLGAHVAEVSATKHRKG